MDEVAAIMFALGALFVGLAILGWAYGDFERPKRTASSPDTTSATPPKL